MTDNLYKMTPRQVREATVECLFAGLVPFIKSSPGMGKSSIVRDIAEALNLELIDHRLSTSAPEDLSGLPRFTDNRATFIPFDLFPLADTPLPEGKDGWLLFLDEFNSAPKSVEAAAYKLILDRMVGQHHLHDRVAIVAAGNLSTDRAIVNKLSTAMQSRVVHIEMTTSLKDWVEDVAYKQSYDPRILAFLNYQPDRLMDFRPDHNENTFCCPRTWEFMNRLITDPATGEPKPIDDAKTGLFAGVITSGVAVEFVQFVKVFENIPNIDEIVRNPTGVKLPTDAATRWAVVSHLISNIDVKQFGPVSTFVNRLPMEFRILFFRGVIIRHPTVVSTPEYTQSITALSQYLREAA